MIVISYSAQAKTWAEFMEGTIWQLQNPVYSNVSEIIGFGEGICTFTTMNLSNGQNGSIKGSYYISNNFIRVTFNNQHEDFEMVYISENKIKLKNKNKNLIYAKSGSPEDQFMNNFLFNSGGGGFTPVTPQQKTYEVCYTCNGGTRCVVCKGSGWYSLFGDGGPCSACNGTGKCWHCNGSGKQ